MSGLIVLRLEDETGFLLVDPATGTTQQIDAEDVPDASELGDVAEAYAMPAEAGIPSRKFYAEEAGIPSRKFYAEDAGVPSRKFYAEEAGIPSRKFYAEDTGIPSRKFYAQDGGIPSRKFYLS